VCCVEAKSIDYMKVGGRCCVCARSECALPDPSRKGLNLLGGILLRARACFHRFTTRV
jgi:hypothetical protein